MGFIKRGVGKVLPDPQDNPTLPGTEDWDESDQEALAQENDQADKASTQVTRDER